MKLPILCVALLTTGSFAPLAQAQTGASATQPAACPAATQGTVAALFDRWNQTLATGDAARVAALYSPDAVLLATVSATPRDTPALIQDYFTHFLENRPAGVIKTRKIRIHCNVAMDAGTYLFVLRDPKTGATTEVPARYSYVYHYEDGDWRIVHHHSSAMPAGH
jgi:uncharacterized protein (TIGR02246 family)